MRHAKQQRRRFSTNRINEHSKTCAYIECRMKSRESVGRVAWVALSSSSSYHSSSSTSTTPEGLTLLSSDEAQQRRTQNTKGKNLKLKSFVTASVFIINNVVYVGFWLQLERIKFCLCFPLLFEFEEEIELRR